MVSNIAGPGEEEEVGQGDLERVTGGIGRKSRASPWKVSQESLKREDVDIGVKANGGSSKLRTETQPLHLSRELLHW